MTYTLGLAGLLIDGAACLLDSSGHVVAAVEEERPTRVKHASMRFSGGLPFRSIASCFKTAGIGWEDVGSVGYFFEPWREFRRMSALRVSKAWRSPAVAAYYLAYHLDALRGHLAVPRLLAGQPGYRATFTYLSHHLTHAASAFYPSPYDTAAILVMDAVSERESTSYFVGEGTRIKRIKRIEFPHSWGFLYALFTQYLGFKPNSDEYKVMGLGTYGKPSFLREILRMIRLKSDGEIRLDPSYFNSSFRGPTYWGERFIRVFGPPRGADQPVTDHHKDLAASIQAALEMSALQMAEDLYRVTGLTRLCIAGGVALNCVMNSRLLLDSPFKELFIRRHRTTLAARWVLHFSWPISSRIFRGATS